MHRRLIPAVCLFAAVFALAGCPTTPPVFDASGVYVGTWLRNTNEPAEQKQEIVACPLTLTLEHNTTAPFPQNRGVKGTVEIDYSCIELPEWIDELPNSNIQVSGVLGDDGGLILFSGGCTTELCTVATLAGFGEDVDAGGAMDTYSGDWSFIILLAGVQPFGVAGTFQVDAVDTQQ